MAVLPLLAFWLTSTRPVSKSVIRLGDEPEDDA